MPGRAAPATIRFAVGPEIAHVEQAFRRMVFNVLAGNRDDHAKNHAFTMDLAGVWRLSPAYDLTPFDGPGGQHNLSVAGEGRAPGAAQFATVAARASMGPAKARRLEEAVRGAGAVAGVSSTSRANAGTDRGGARVVGAGMMVDTVQPARTVPTPRFHLRKRRQRLASDDEVP